MIFRQLIYLLSVSFIFTLFFQLVSFIVPINLITINSGFIFGIFNNNNFAIVCLIIFSILAITYFIRQSDRKNQFFLILLISGIFSNLIDRIFRNGVIDYIKITFWPTFNLADIAITFSLIFIAMKLIIKKTAS